MNRTDIVAIVILAIALCGTDAAHSSPFAYITNQDSNNVSVIDTATNTVVATVAVGGNPRGVAGNPAGTRVYSQTRPAPASR